MNNYEFNINIRDAQIKILINKEFFIQSARQHYNDSLALIHNHSFCELFGIINVPFSIKKMDGIFTVTDKCIVTVPKYSYHFSSSQSPNYGFLFTAVERRNKDGAGFYSSLSAILNKPEITRYQINDSLIFIMAELKDALEIKIIDREYIGHLLCIFFIKFVGMSEIEDSQVTPQNNNYIFKISDYVNANYQSKIYIDDLAKSLDLSRRQILRIIKNNFNTTFTELVVQKRVAAAAYMLTETDCGVEEIVTQSGFSSNPALCLAFKKIHGVSPLQFRKKSKTKNDP